MATFFSDVQVGTWSGYRMLGTLTGNVNRSGNTVTLSGMSISLRCPDGGAWGSDGYSFTVNNTSTSFTISAAGDGYSLGSYLLNDTSISVSAAQTSASVGWSSADNYSGSFDVSFPSGVVAPTTPTVTLDSVTETSITVSYGTTSFGSPSSGTVSLYGGTSAAPTTQIASKTTTGQSTFTWTGLNSGTTYYLRSNATNGSATSDYSTELTVTTSAPATGAVLYGSVGGQTKKVKKLYGPVNGQTKLIKKLYGSHNGVTKLVYEA